MDGPHFVYPSPVDGQLGGFCLLAAVNHAAMNTCVQVFVGTPVCNSLEYETVVTGSCGWTYRLLSMFFLLLEVVLQSNILASSLPLASHVFSWCIGLPTYTMGLIIQTSYLVGL